MFARISNVKSKMSLIGLKYEAKTVHLLLRYFFLRLISKMTLNEAIQYGALDPHLPVNKALDFVGRGKLVSVLKKVNGQGPRVFSDKIQFCFSAISHDFPIPKFYLLFRGGEIYNNLQRIVNQDELFSIISHELPEDFIVKLALGECGLGINLFKRVDDKFVSNENQEYDGNSLLEMLKSGDIYGDCLVQEKVVNHKDIKKITDVDVLQTIRIVTFINSKGESSVYSTWWKVSNGKSITDNFIGGSTGNQILLLNRETGTVEKVFSGDSYGCVTDSIIYHPVSGKQLTGFTLPNWDQVLDLSHRLCRAYSESRAIGWDIAITESGPVVIEGNTEWGAMGQVGPYFNREDLNNLIKGVA